MLHCRVTGAYWCRAGCSGGPWGTAANTGEGELHPAPALPQHLPGDGVGRGDTGPPRTVRRGLSPHVSPLAYDPVSPHGPHMPLCPPHIPTSPCSFVCCRVLTPLRTPMSPVSSCLSVPMPSCPPCPLISLCPRHVPPCPCMSLCPHASVSPLSPCPRVLHAPMPHDPMLSCPPMSPCLCVPAVSVTPCPLDPMSQCPNDPPHPHVTTTTMPLHVPVSLCPCVPPRPNVPQCLCAPCTSVSPMSPCPIVFLSLTLCPCL